MMEQLSGRDRPARPEFEVVPSSLGQGLTVEGLTKRFGSVVAVDRLSMQVHPGQILALLGPNGAGKPPPSSAWLDSFGPTPDGSPGRATRLVPSEPAPWR